MDVINKNNQSNIVETGKGNFEKLISDTDYRIYEIINFNIIINLISLFGVVANVMNIMVFCRQGFESTMNISFMGLAISDLCSLVTMLLCTFFLTPFLDMLGAKVVSSELQYLGASLPHICFTRITSWITVFITAERCLCITFPLLIKQLITPQRTTMIICSIYILIILSFEPEYETSYYGWKFDVKTNKTLIGLLFTSNRQKADGVTFILFGILGLLSFIAVCIFTIILVIQLNKKNKWRRKANLEKLQSESISSRDKKTVRMVVMIATVMIVCFTPGVATSLATFFEPEFNITGRYVNIFLVVWSFVDIFETLNSSVNIFLYYYMSSKYRQTFHLIFSCWLAEM